jgi:hypothetical protein
LRVILPHENKKPSPGHEEGADFSRIAGPTGYLNPGNVEQPCRDGGGLGDRESLYVANLVTWRGV